MSKDAKGVEYNYSLLSIFTSILYWIGAIASATQGYFSINAFITSLSVVPGLNFLSLIPYLYIFLSATTIALYSIIVEQQIFHKHFVNLIKQLFANLFPSLLNSSKSGIKYDKTYHEQTKELKLKLTTLSEPYEENSTDTQPPKNRHRSFLSWTFYKVRFYFGHLIAFVIVSLRAIVSIGSTMLGLKSIFLVIASAFLLPAPPTYFILAYALMSAVSYIIKSSQNLVCQFNETLKLLGFNRFIKKDFEDTQREYKLQLKHQVKGQPVAETPKVTKLSWWQYFSSKLSRGNMPWWKYIARRFFDVVFIVGAVGASMTGFFSIDKFFSQMGSISFLSFFSLVPAGAIVGAACTIAIYTLFVEQKILYNYFETLIEKWFSSTPIKKIATLEKEIKSKRNKILAIYQQPLMQEVEGLQNKISRLQSLSLDNIQPTYSRFRLFLSITGTVFILLLRAITSIGPSTLGLTAAVQLIAKFAFATTLGPWVFAPCAFMALGGYIIKCSQNLSDHYYNTLSDMFGVTLNGNKKQKDLLKELNKEHLSALETFNHERKLACQKAITKPLPGSTPSSPNSPGTLQTRYYNPSQPSLAGLADATSFPPLCLHPSGSSLSLPPSPSSNP